MPVDRTIIDVNNIYHENIYHENIMVAETTNTLTVTLPSDREIRLTRSFDAPRELVFDAFTTPEHVRRWWGCGVSSLTVCEIDLRPGGSWRYVMRGPDGIEYGFSGVYTEILRPERLVYTSIFDMYPDNPAVESIDFTEREGKTTITSLVSYESKEVRDAVLQSGMETGAAESYDRLAELLETIGRTTIG